MLSRFSKLPVLSSLLSTNGKFYQQEEIDKAISSIKKLGKREVNNSDECLADITKILSLMKKFEQSLHVQRVSCHALSNLAMQVVAARFIIQKNGFKLIEKCISLFPNDHKLHWLASSAIWNLARPPVNRSIIGENGVKLMLKILNLHNDKEKVVNTAIGALSNLSLQDDLKNMIAESRHLDVILQVLHTHLKMKSLSVMTSGAGLLANLAVNDSHASMLVKKNALEILMSLLTWNLNNGGSDVEKDGFEKLKKQTGGIDETLYRNTCAALNNLVTADGFLDSFLLNKGIEQVFSFLNVYKNNELYMNLLENCLINIDADSSIPTTSLHLACYHNKLNIFKELYSKYRFSFDLNSTDGHSMTVLDYAISRKFIDIVEFLCKCGATHFTMNHESISKEINTIIKKSEYKLKQVRMENQKALVDALPYVPVDLCRYMLKFQHNIDMLQGMDMY